MYKLNNEFEINYNKEIIPKKLNPDLDKKLEKEVNFFLKWGYLIIDKALTDNQIVLLRKTFNKTFKKLKGKDHIDYNLFEYDKNFLFLLDNKPVIKRISAILGNCIQLHSASARLSSPGSKNQNWHRDGHWPVDPNGTPIGSIPGQINCGYYLDPLTEKNGPIAIVPGSQKALFKPPKKDFEFPDQKIIYAKPGQAIIFNGWIYHRGLGNKSKSNRRVFVRISCANVKARFAATCDFPTPPLPPITAITYPAI